MKTSSLTYLGAVGCLLLVPAAFSQTDADAAITVRGPNHRVWEWTERERTALGADAYHTNSYTELKSGLHYLEAGEYKETVEAFEITPEGYAIARRGPTKVVISPVFNDAEGAVDLETADGKRLRMTLLGLSLFDRASGRSLQVASAGTSVGQQVAENVILFTNCFAESGFAASVRYVYRAAEFHQDVLLAEKLDVALLEEAGFSADSTVLEIWTEVFAGPEPTVRERVVKRETNPVLRERMAEPDVVDQHLDFGELKLPVAGKAYLEAEGETMDKPINVYKRWLKLDNGRRFLVETIPMATLQPLFSMLPDSRTPFDAPANERYYAGRQPPKPALAQRNGESILLASLNGSRQGPQLVLDYSTISGTISGHTFRGDTTYYISAPVWLYGNTTFEGGAVIKYAVNTALDLSSATLKWLPTAYRPVIFTAKDDHSVGEAIGSGALNGYYADPALYFSGSHVSITNFHIRHARQAISAQYGSPYFYHGQIVNCANGVTMYNGSAYLRNVLLANVTAAFNNLSYSYVYAENVTVSGTANSSLATGSPWVVNLANSVLANVTSLGSGGTVSGNNNGFYNSPAFGTLPVVIPSGGPGPFQQRGAGYYYLAGGSPFLNQGTTAIDATLLADLKKKTTYTRPRK